MENCSSIHSQAVLDSATKSCQIQFQTYYGSTSPSGPSNTYYTIVISQTVGIIILAGLLVVGVGMITCAIYMIRRIRLRRHYVEAPINITNEHINVQYNIWKFMSEGFFDIGSMKLHLGRKALDWQKWEKRINIDSELTKWFLWFLFQ